MANTKEKRLDALNHELAIALATLNYPGPPWPGRSTQPSDEASVASQDLDVLIVGAGMCGQSVAFALRREGIHRLRVVDKANCGQEGPWTSYARMNTLRSPKHLTGPDLGIPSLSFRTWFSTQHGEAAWTSLYKIDRLDWNNYLHWLRKQTGVRVDNGIEFKSVKPHGEDPDHKLEVSLEHRSDGRKELVSCRHLVLALGRDGSGQLRWPRFRSWQSDGPGRCRSIWHAADPIDFEGFRGKRVAVLGAGASAFDNAACALEAGAASVELHVRRAQLPQINKSKGASYPGFQRGFYRLPDAQRWWMMNYIFDVQVPPPHESVHRCAAFDQFKICLNHAWEDLCLTVDSTQKVEVFSNQGRHLFDHVILATGFSVDLMARADLANFAPLVDCWKDHVSADEADAFAESASFPYLGDGFEFLPRADVKGQDWLRRIHAFNWGCAMSHGPLAGDIPGLRVGVERLTQALCARLFSDSFAAHQAALIAFDDRELESTPWFINR